MVVGQLMSRQVFLRVSFSEFVIFLISGIVNGWWNKDDKRGRWSGGGAVMEEAVRLREPNRKQMILRPEELDALIGAEHPARALWRVLEGMELARFYAPIKARAGSAGRDATDPRMLLALWLYGLVACRAADAPRRNCAHLQRLRPLHQQARHLCARELHPGRTGRTAN